MLTTVIGFNEVPTLEVFAEGLEAGIFGPICPRFMAESEDVGPSAANELASILLNR